MRLARLYKHFIRNRFINKILLISTVISLVTFLLLTFIIFRLVSSLLLNNHQDTTRIVLADMDEQMLKKIEFVRQTVKRMYYDESFSGKFLYFMNVPADSIDGSTIEARRELDNFMMPLFLENADLRRINVFHSIDNTFLTYTENSINQYSGGLWPNNDQLTQLSNKEQLLFTYPTSSSKYPVGSNKSTYSITMNLTAKGSNQVIGMLSFEFLPEGFESRMNRYPRLKGDFIVLKHDNTVIFDSTGTLYGQRFEAALPEASLREKQWEMKLGDEHYIMNATAPNRYGITVVSIIQKSEMFTDIYKVNWTLFLAGLSCLVLSWILIFLASSRFSSRVRYIVQTIKKIRAGSLNERILVGKDHDELYLFSIHFNKMCDEIQEYIERIYVSEISRKDAELKEKTALLRALQAQINPHFLYNTLEAIRMKTVSNGDKDASEMIYMMAKLLRYTINQEPWIKVKEEVRNCTLFIELFKIRFKDNLQYEFRIHPDTADQSMPRNMLQPLIENYFKHGFRTNRDDNRIEIRTRLADDQMVIEIEDNGLGIPEHVLAALNNRLSVGNETSGIGISNIRERLRIVYGDRTSLKIDSRVDRGTTIYLMIPFPFPFETEGDNLV